MTAETFSDWLLRQIGPNWVIARRTPRILERYGAQVVCLTNTQYSALVAKYERETGLSAHGYEIATVSNVSLEDVA